MKEKKFRFIISIFAVSCMMLGSLSSFAANEEVYSLRDLPKELAQKYPVRETNTSVRYAPWLVNYNLQHGILEKRNIAAGENMQVITSMAMSPVNEDYMLLGYDCAGLSRSIDGGKNWERVKLGNGTWGVHSILYHPAHAETVYCVSAGSSDGDFQQNLALHHSNNVGIFKSTDAGKTWKQVLNAMIWPGYFSNRTLAFDDENNMYAMTCYNIVKSEDDGETWKSIYEYPEFAQVTYDFDVSEDGQRIMTATSNGFNVSLDGGQTWEERSAKFSKDKTIVGGFAVDPRDDEHWVASFTNKKYQGIYQTYDSGRTWRRMSNSPRAAYDVVYGPVNEDGIPALYVMQQRNPPLLISFDEGKNWTKPMLEEKYTNRIHDTAAQLTGFAVSENNPDFCIYGQYGPFVSHDGGRTFEWSGSGESGINVYTMVFDSNDVAYFGAADIATFKTNRPLKSVDDLPAGEYLMNDRSRYTYAIAIDPKDENHVFFGNDNELFESYDGGMNVIDRQDAALLRGRTLVFNKNNPDILYAQKGRSYDGGKTFVENEIQINVVSPVNPDIVWGLVDEKILYKSEDCGNTWTKMHEFDFNVKIYKDEFNEKGVWIAGRFKRYIADYVDGEIRVLSETIELPNSLVHDIIAEDPNRQGHIIASCTTTLESPYSIDEGLGIIETFDNGKTWHVMRGLPGIGKMHGISFQKSTGYVYLGGYFGLYIYEPEIYEEYLEKEGIIK